MQTLSKANRRSGRILVAMVSFLVTSLALVLIVSWRYLIPAIDAARGADELARKRLAALSSLVLALVLVWLVILMILIIRPGRLFFPRKAGPRTRTTYIDAWSESARRMKTPPQDEEAEEEPGKQ